MPSRLAFVMHKTKGKRIIYFILQEANNVQLEILKGFGEQQKNSLLVKEK